MKSVKLNIIIYIFNLIILMSFNAIIYNSKEGITISGEDISSSKIYQIIFRNNDNSSVNTDNFFPHNIENLFDGSLNSTFVEQQKNDDDFIFIFDELDYNSITHIEIYTSKYEEFILPNLPNIDGDTIFSLDSSNLIIYYQDINVRYPPLPSSSQPSPPPSPAPSAHIGTRGNKIGNDSSGNLIIKTISGNFLEMSCNEVKIDKDLNVYGNVDICGVLKINDININGDLKIINLDICGVLKINDYSFPEISIEHGDKVLKLNTDATQLEWSDTHSDISENILQVRGNIVFDNILLKEDELLNIQSVHTLENGFLYYKITELEKIINQLNANK